MHSAIRLFRPMSPSGQTWTRRPRNLTSVLLPRPDITDPASHVCLVPTRDLPSRFFRKNRSLKTAPLRLTLAHDDSIADFEGHQVFTNLQRTVIGFARSRHDIINGCPRNLVAGKKD